MPDCDDCLKHGFVGSKAIGGKHRPELTDYPCLCDFCYATRHWGKVREAMQRELQDLLEKRMRKELRRDYENGDFKPVR